MYNGRIASYEDATEDAYQDATPQRTRKRRAPIKTPVQRAEIARERADLAQQRAYIASERYQNALQHADRYDALKTQINNALYSTDAYTSADRLASFLYRLARGGSSAERVLVRAINALEDRAVPEDDPYSTATEYERAVPEDRAPFVFYPDTDTENERY